MNSRWRANVTVSRDRKACRTRLLEKEERKGRTYLGPRPPSGRGVLLYKAHTRREALDGRLQWSMGVRNAILKIAKFLLNNKQIFQLLLTSRIRY